MADIPYAFVYNKLEAIALRGTADQMALAAWLVDELNKPPRDLTQASASKIAAMHEYKVPGGSEAVWLFYPANSGSLQRLQEIAVAVRSGADIKRVFINNAQKAVASRGTAAQLATAERLVREMDKAPGVR